MIFCIVVAIGNVGFQTMQVQNIIEKELWTSLAIHWSFTLLNISLIFLFFKTKRRIIIVPLLYSLMLRNVYGLYDFQGRRFVMSALVYQMFQIM